MLSRTQSELLSNQARELFARGLNAPEIAQELGVDARTIRRWRLEAGRRGKSWDKERTDERLLCHENVLKLLERRFGRMVIEWQEMKVRGDADVAEYETRIHRVLQILNSYRRTGGDVLNIMTAMAAFVEFCDQTATEPEKAVIVRLQRRYYDAIVKGKR